MRSVFIAGNDPEITRMFQERGWEVTEDVHNPDLLQFIGGPDVHPSLYNEVKHRASRCSRDRDTGDYKVLETTRCMKRAGICRGAQFLHTCQGGALIQHVEGHLVDHQIIRTEGEPIKVSSTHHQMMIHEERLGGELLAWAQGVATKKEGMHRKGFVYQYSGGSYAEDAEVILYGGRTASLCFQPHPENVTGDSDCQDYYFKLIEKLFEES